LPASLAQSEQPVSMDVRDAIRARQTWLLNVGHCHQISLCEP
jgi:hypothetical protein